MMHSIKFAIGASLLIATFAVNAGCFLDTHGNYICDYGRNLGGQGYSYGDINGKDYEYFRNGSSVDIEIENKSYNCYNIGSIIDCK